MHVDPFLEGTWVWPGRIKKDEGRTRGIPVRPMCSFIDETDQAAGFWGSEGASSSFAASERPNFSARVARRSLYFSASAKRDSRTFFSCSRMRIRQMAPKRSRFEASAATRGMLSFQVHVAPPLSKADMRPVTTGQDPSLTPDEIRVSDCEFRKIYPRRTVIPTIRKNRSAVRKPGNEIRRIRPP